MHRIVQEPLLGHLRLGDIGERPDDPNDIAIGPNYWASLQQIPEVVAIRRAQAEVEIDAATTLFEHRIEAGTVTVTIERMQNLEPAGGRPLQRTTLETQLQLGLMAHMDAIRHHVPVEDDVS